MVGGGGRAAGGLVAGGQSLYLGCVWVVGKEWLPFLSD